MDKRISINPLVECLYPRIALLDEICVSEKYALVMLGLLKDMAVVAGSEGQIEVYKVQHKEGSGIPIIECISTLGVDDALLEELFDDFAVRISALDS